LTWDVIFASTLAASYVDATSQSAAELEASRKSAKYANLEQSHIFQLLAFENVAYMKRVFISKQQISSVSGDDFEDRFLFQRQRQSALQCHIIE